jgi:hypothetical protein
MPPQTHDSLPNDANAVFTVLFITAEERANPYPPYHQLRGTRRVQHADNGYMSIGIWQAATRVADAAPALNDAEREERSA